MISADALRPYVGRWVALFGGEVIADSDCLLCLIASLRTSGRTADATFRVPIDPSIDVLCFD